VSFAVHPKRVAAGPSGTAVTLSWNAVAAGVESVKLFVKQSTGAERLFAHLGSEGSQQTGPWVVPGTEFTMTDPSGERQLAKVVVEPYSRRSP
jgi:hypothetical protein